MSSKDLIIKQIVDLTRADILTDIQYCEAQNIAHEGWNEEESGAAWLDNEIHAYSQMSGTILSRRCAWENLHSVNDIVQELSLESDEYLRGLLHFTRNGGSANLT